MLHALVFSYLLAASWLPQENIIIAPTPPYGYVISAPGDASAVTLGLRVTAFRHVFVGGSVRTYETYDTALLFSPYRADYVAYAGVKFGPISLRIFHECDHPVVSEFGAPLPWPVGVNRTAVTLSFAGKFTLPGAEDK